MSSFDEIMKKIENDSVKVGILGLGYVGLPLAVLMANRGVNILGLEKNEDKANRVNNCNNYIGDITSEELESAVKSGNLEATSDFSRIAECDATIMCVPTPLDKFKKPDMRFIESACKDIGKYMTKGTFISLESTTYPTTTEDFMKPIIESASGLKEGEDFWLCFSPERIDPGNETFKTENTPKVVGTLSEDGMKIAMGIYGKAIQNLHPVSSPRVAEMVKILENTYRLINISMINELALLAGKMDINIWEVIEAAKTKPFGFQAFYPGPGIGGHCIPLDPFYLEYIAKNFNFDLKMIETAGHIDNMMPHRMSIKIASALNRHKKAINGSKVLFMGVAYKPNIDDPRESPALNVIDEVAGKGAEVLYHDPYISNCVTPKGRMLNNSDLTDELLNSVDLVVFTTNHSCFDAEDIVSKSKLVVDMRNAVKEASDKVYKL
ncbi:nucleotide sugar dehydrogenase [Thiospirochaeta perfilievii]|uniref:Nucleotide sugar dehydrogenase n=1 Tax=Thiospirochaeta perfilievii TaxID=252967 RepID=A0A5C1QF13_9SPIO|nr:nucleotide sugar dehydrogenase [Thiospirochaeta perfilievii]QEN05670.1 nucleotide sugar dehydrogenase [Thiospirochaeta perfilievii]